MDIPTLYTVNDPDYESIYHKIHTYVSNKYDLRYNEIAQEFIIRLKGRQKWNELNLNSLLIELVKAKIRIRTVVLEIYLNSHLIQSVNPFKQYYNSLPPWDGIDHIKKLLSHVPTDDDELFNYHFCKWIVRTIRCALEPKYYNKNCLVLAQEMQNSGKTTFCRFICPPELKNYIAENIGYDKDGIIQLSKNILINLDEIDRIDSRAIKAYKSFFSKEKTNLRLPYAKKNSNLPRICSFIGSTNLLNFLKDDTGNVRWICFEILGKIDFQYSKVIDINKVWSQAYHLAYLDENYDPELTNEDVVENEKRNERHRVISIEEELISEIFEKSNSRDDFLTATAITNFVKSRYSYANPISIGKAITKLGYKRINCPKNGNKGYMIKFREQ